MPRKATRVPEFGDWVRKLRIDAELTQAAAAEELKFRQPYWSKIEQQGVVPDEPGLRRICAYFNQDFDELEQFLREATNLGDLERRLTLEFEAFKSWLKDLPPPVRIFVIRQDEEVVDPEVVSWHHEILRDTPRLTINILFRFSKPEVWSTFRDLYDFVKDAFETENEKKELAEKLRGFYRNESFEEREVPEAGFKPIPMSQPVVLVLAGEDPISQSIFTYGYHWQSEVEFKGTIGTRSSLRHGNLVLSAPVDHDRADEFRKWIKFDLGRKNPNGTYWVSIPLTVAQP